MVVDGELLVVGVGDGVLLAFGDEEALGVDVAPDAGICFALTD